LGRFSKRSESRVASDLSVNPDSLCDGIPEGTPHETFQWAEESVHSLFGSICAPSFAPFFAEAATMAADLCGASPRWARPELSAIPAGKRPSGDLAYNVAKIEGPFGRPRGVDIDAPILLDLGEPGSGAERVGSLTFGRTVDAKIVLLDLK